MKRMSGSWPFALAIASVLCACGSGQEAARGAPPPADKPSPATTHSAAAARPPAGSPIGPSCKGQANIACFQAWLAKQAGGGRRGAAAAIRSAVARAAGSAGVLAESANDIIGSTDEPGPLDGQRIPGGKDYDGLPAIGAITIRQNGQFNTHCTGTLIGRFTVLTAAHCLAGFERQDMEFVMSPDATAPADGTRFKIFQRVPHAKYDPTKYGVNDIGLVYLDPDKAPAASIARISLVSTAVAAKVLDGKSELTFVGYGYMKDADGYKAGLGRKRLVKMAASASPDSPTFRYGDATKNTCNGDSGGPALWIEAAGTTPLLVGVTSWGDTPCKEFGVDMRVDAYLDDWLPKGLDKPPALDKLP